MNYSWALNEAKAGKCVRRECWPDRYVYFVPGSTFVVNRLPLSRFYEKGEKVEYLGHLDMRISPGVHSTWAPSNEDQFAEDWDLY